MLLTDFHKSVAVTRKAILNIGDIKPQVPTKCVVDVRKHINQLLGALKIWFYLTLSRYVNNS